MSDRKPLWPRIRKVWVRLGLVVFVVFTGWSLLAYRATDNARQALIGNDRVAVVRGAAGWSFTPRSGAVSPSVGLLFVAGALVEPAAYAPLARTVALAGYPVLLIELPRRGAFGGAVGGEVLGRARDAMQRMPEVDRWVIAGHSRGGEVASRLARNGGPKIGGLVLVGTSHPRDFTLADLTIPVTKILGTRDGVSEVEKSERNRRLLPATTRWVMIEGGNHSQFGWYGFQPGDHWATISRDRQQALTIQAILEALAAVRSSRLSPERTADAP